MPKQENVVKVPQLPHLEKGNAHPLQSLLLFQNDAVYFFNDTQVFVIQFSLHLILRPLRKHHKWQNECSFVMELSLTEPEEMNMNNLDLQNASLRTSLDNRCDF